MTSTEHHDRTAIETRLVEALGAAAAAVEPPGEPVRPVPAGARPADGRRRLLAVVAVTAVVSAGAGAAAAAAAMPDGNRSGELVEAPTAAAAPRDTRPVDLDGDGVDDPITVTGRELRVELSRTGTADVLSVPARSRLLVVQKVDDGAVAVISGQDNRILGFLRLGPDGIDRTPQRLSDVAVATVERVDGRLRVRLQ